MAAASKTVKQVLEGGADYLSAKGVENPRIACELLLSRLLACKRLDLYLRFDASLGEKHLDAMRRGVQRVAAGEPVQYIVGQTEFMGHALKVDKRALIPRPETEVLVDTVLTCEGVWSGSTEDDGTRPIIVDLGTGTGCIAIALAAAKPEGVYVGLDISAEAVALARENAASLGLDGKIAFVEGELADCVEPQTVTAIVSNPPYIATADYERLPVHIRSHEPRVALDGGATGLDVMDVLVQDATAALIDGGFLFVEIGADQGAAVTRLMQEAGFSDIAVKKDLAGRDRVVSGRLA